MDRITARSAFRLAQHPFVKRELPEPLAGKSQRRVAVGHGA